jgi:hypothetical protein
MQSPILIFDHVNQNVAVVQPGPVHDKRVQAALAAQRAQLTSSGTSPAR